MKKIITALVTLVMLASLSITAFADLGAPEFDNWYVICGMDGYYYEDPDFGHGYENEVYKVNIKPGDKYQVYYYAKEVGKYRLIGKGDIMISESDLNSKFFDAKKTYDKTNGKKLDSEIKGNVTADGGLVLRQGPATTFPAYKTIPKNTELSYQYTYSYGGYDWGYVTYNGTSGWVATKYINGTAVTTTTTTTTTTASSTEEVIESQDDTDVLVPNADTETSGSFFSDTKNVVILCCVGAMIIVLTAVIILVLVLRNKEQKKMMQNSFNPNNYNNNYNPNNYNPNNYNYNNYNQNPNNYNPNGYNPNGYNPNGYNQDNRR